MKRYIYVLGAAALVMFAACQKEETTVSKATLSATLEQQVDNDAAKTALTLGNAVVWSAGDQIKVHTTDGLETLTLTDGQGTTTGSFSPTTGDDPDYAIYPASACTSLDGSTFTFTLPATQTYAENSFANGANVAVAAISGGNMAFKNVCGVLKLQLKGSMKVSKIELTGKSGEKLNGTFTVDVAANPFVGAVKDGEPTEPEKKVTLDCSHVGETSEGKADGGVHLGTEISTIFDIIVPVSAFAGGFEAKITDVAGETFYVTLETTEDNTIARSTITRMPSKTLSLLPEEYTEVLYISCSGNQKFNTGISTDNKRVDVDFAFDSGKVKGAGLAVIGNNCANDQIDLIGYRAHITLYQGNYVIGQDEGNFITGYTSGRHTISRIPGDFLGRSGAVEIIDGTVYEQENRHFSGNSEVQFFVGWRYVDNIYFKGDYYLVKISDATHLLRFYIPAVVSKDGGVTDVKGNPAPQGTVGMYDIINGEFYTNDGAGSFTAGPELTD